MAERRLSLRHIEAFRAVLATGSMTAAARHMHTSQPQVSRLIGQLEGITGFPLFLRHGSRLSATPDAGLFSEDVERTFSGLETLELAAARIRSFGASQLSVAAMPRLAGGVLARAVARFKYDWPNVVVSIHSGDAGAVQSWIGSGICDVGLAMVYGPVAGAAVRHVLTLDCVVILPRGHALAGSAQLRAQDLDGQAFVAFSSGSPFRARVDEALARAGVQPRVVVEANLGAAVCALVATGLGVSVINPLAAAEESLAADIESRPFLPAISLSLVLLYPQSGPKSRLVDAFTRCATELIREEYPRHGVNRHTGPAS